jgi:3-oxoadipate enol-lactonase
MEIAFDEVGAGGPVVLLLHSTVCDRRMWEPQMPVLAGAGYRVVRADLPGFGGTPMPAGPYDDAASVIALLDLLGVRQAAVVGSSGGGQVALEVAARFPGRVTALALLCAAWHGHQRSDRLLAFGHEEDRLLEAGDIDAAVELNVATWVGPAAPAPARDAVRTMQRDVFDIQLATSAPGEPADVPWDPRTVTARTLLVSGAHDLPDFTATADELADLLPSARRVHLDWAGHLPSLESPELLNPVLLQFLAEGHGPSAP